MLPQDVFLNLTHRVARQVLGKDDALGLFVARETVLERADDGLFIEDGAGLAYDDSGHAFSEIGMRHTDHSALNHTVDLVDLAFDLLRIDVVSTRNHQVLAAADDVDIAVPVDLAEIAADEETVGGEFGRGFSGMRQ